MNNCKTLTKDMLADAIKVKVPENSLNFKTAKQRATENAREVASDPVLLAWYERETGRFSPDVECCGEEKPSWMIYAESRGGNITVDINDGAYVFMYADFEKLS
jgi:hypothetical protein